MNNFRNQFKQIAKYIFSAATEHKLFLFIQQQFRNFYSSHQHTCFGILFTYTEFLC